MAKALVAIGVGKTEGGFPPLMGASQDAREFHDWGLRQGFDAHLLVDDAAPVTMAEVFRAINGYVKTGTYSQIVVYFSGHGVLKAPGCELWLMSDAPENPNEVINVCGSIQAARSSGIEHVVFISDACRSLPSDMKSASLGAGIVFPFLGSRLPLPEVDTFYATIPGEVANEVPPDATSPRNRGLLTQCLLDALVGNVPDVIREHEGGVGRVVPCRPLKAWLATAMPDAASKIHMRLQQFPDIRIESDSSRYLSMLSGTPEAATSNSDSRQTLQSADIPQAERSQRRRLVPSRTSARPVRPRSSTPASRSFAELEIREFESGQAAIDFAENRSGIVVRGGEVYTAVAASGPISPLREAASVWGFFPPVDQDKLNAVQPIALRFSGGNGAVLALMPGYVAMVDMHGAEIASIRYRMTPATRKQRPVVVPEEDVERLRAKLVAMARKGMLTAMDVHAIGEPMVMELIVGDPMLAMHVAYAYASSGRFDEVEALAERVSRHLGCLPFDVAMLAEQRGDGPLPATSPGIPVLTQGWLMMGRFEFDMPEALRMARHFLSNSLWATFSHQGMNILERHLFRG